MSSRPRLGPRWRSTHAGPRLEDDAAAAHAGLTRDADAASAALHAHGEHQATQIVTDADRVADAVYRGTR